MKTSTLALVSLGLGGLLMANPLPAQTRTNPAPAAPLFPDPQLERAMRRHVFEKRDNQQPLVEADVEKLSVLNARGAGITNLAGLERCRSLASLELAGNQITRLDALRDLKQLQFLNLASNRVADLAPLAGLTALQYLDLSDNQVRQLQPLAGLTNLTTLHLVRNQITDLAPLTGLGRPLVPVSRPQPPHRPQRHRTPHPPDLPQRDRQPDPRRQTRRRAG